MGDSRVRMKTGMRHLTGTVPRYLAGFVIAIFLLASCRQPEPVIADPEAYRESVREWRAMRFERLKAPEGWLNLAGLYWLEEGENAFGSDPSNDVVFPEKAAPFCGTLNLKEGRVRLHVNKGCLVTSGDTLVRDLFLSDDQSANPTRLRQGDLAWYIIRRGEKFGIRLRDLSHPGASKLEEIPAYPIQPSYVVAATLERFEEPRIFEVATAVPGYTEKYESPGTLRFRLHKEELTLHPFSSGNGYFIIFTDQTTGSETYGAGRYMYAAPDSTGRILLDFNKAYNPPCAFTPYATCPRPPDENFLPVEVKAGEKRVPPELK